VQILQSLCSSATGLLASGLLQHSGYNYTVVHLQIDGEVEYIMWDGFSGIDWKIVKEKQVYRSGKQRRPEC